VSFTINISANVYNSSDCIACQGKNHTDSITPKLCGAYYVVKSGFYISNPDHLKEDYFIFLLYGPATSVPTIDKQVAWQEASNSDITGTPESL
jgi:hypothetical protein